MNRYTMPRIAALFFALSLALAGCNSQSQPAMQEAPLAGAAIGGDFELLDKNGETVRWTDFAGKYRILYFGYAFCPDVCPQDVAKMVRGLKLYADSKPELAAQIQPIFITIDPERDTPEVVGEFAAAFSNDLIGLTGTPEQIEQTADAFRVYYARGEENDNFYLMDHSAITYLFGPNGEPIATLPTDKGPQAVADELAKWVR